MAGYMGMLNHLNHKTEMEFITANNFTNLRAGVQHDEFDIFLWETFTTKPYFDNYELRKVSALFTY
jgi:hypothetical protein